MTDREDGAHQDGQISLCTGAFAEQKISKKLSARSWALARPENDPICIADQRFKKSVKIIEEQSKRMPVKDFFVINRSLLWWHALSELEVSGITANTDSESFIHQLLSSNLKSVEIIRRLDKHINWEILKRLTPVQLGICCLILAKRLIVQK